MVGKAVLTTIILITGIIFIVSQVEADQQPAGIVVASIAQPSSVKVDIPGPTTTAPAAGERSERFIVDDTSRWTADELVVVNRVLTHTFQALNDVGLDGRLLLDDYRFRRVSGEHIDEALGLIGLVNHDTHIISLSDAAFVRLGGFYIYHELGHAIDHQLGRELSDQFHAQIIAMAGTDNITAVGGTADGYWLRAHAHEVREEATADAFALWVGSEQADMRRPIFAGTPLNADYDGIVNALVIAMVAINGS
jgi:hypothetical protein